MPLSTSSTKAVCLEEKVLNTSSSCITLSKGLALWLRLYC